MSRHESLLAPLGLALASLAAIASVGPSRAADLGPYKGPPPYYVAAPPSPCALYEQSFNDALHSIRHTAKLFRGQERQFDRLKRRRNNDGFDGPDIAINAQMSAEQIDVATGATVVALSVADARRLHCFSPARLNEIDNEASRIRIEVADHTIWVDPVTYR